MVASKRMAVIRIALQRFGGEHEALPVRHRQRDLGAKLVRPMRLALGDAHHLGRMKAVELVLARALLGQKTLRQAQQTCKAKGEALIPGDFPGDIAIHPSRDRSSAA